MAILKIKYTAGLNTDRIDITVLENNGETVRERKNGLTFGYDISWSLDDYHYSIKQHEDKVKYGWGDHPYYNIKMFVGYVLDGYTHKIGPDWRNPDNWTGYNVFNDKEFTREDIQHIINMIEKGYEEDLDGKN